MSVLVACGSEPGSSDGDQGEETETTSENLDADLNRIAASLATDKTSLSAQSGLTVTVTLTNRANHPVHLLKWLTPVEGIHEPLFAVTRDGEEVAYVGRHYKRPAPRARDYVFLAAGESLSRTVDVADTYDMSVSGNYTVRYRFDVPTAKEGVVSNDVGMYVEGRPSLLAATNPDELTTAIGGTSFSGGCSSSEKSTLTTALSSAAAYASGASSYLNGTPGSKPRYTTWFGSYTSSRWSTAKSHFAKIKDALDTKNYVLDCSCTDDYYAYVYSNQPYKVYLCNAFWSAPMTGTDSKAGTIVHETSHFNVVAGTDDHTYGKTSCKRLATTSPTQALDNADSHEYFAENSPALN
jgi:peptidyl-Lys metalloendopeptidase